MRISQWLAAVVVACSLQVHAQQLPPLEAYGSLPTTELVTISPSGGRLAYRSKSPERDVVLVIDLASKKLLGGVAVNEVDPRQLMFVDDDNLVLIAGRTMRAFGFRGQFDYSAAFSLHVPTQEVRNLLKNARDLFPGQSGLGRVVGVASDGKSVFMPAFHTDDVVNRPRYGLYEVPLTGKRPKLVAEGSHAAVDWFVDDNGDPLVREDFDNQDDLYQIWALGKARKAIYESEGEIAATHAVGLTPDRASLIVATSDLDDDHPAFHKMDIARGEIGERLVGSETGGDAIAITDINRVVHGFEYQGFKPRYEFFDQALNDRVRQIQAAFPDMSVTLVSWSDGFRDLVFLISGGWHSGAYVLFEAGSAEPQMIAEARQGFDNNAVVPTQVINYPARDGMEIPALLTAKPATALAGDAPLIVMPHGGPASHDVYGFAWRAQYFASRGYVVLQPQFRGSTGFGAGHQAAGAGEWGRKMQSDLDDGVDALVAEGLVDPDRVCMIGSSYGGYAALAAGAFSAGKYRCLVSFAGVSDLRQMLQFSREKYGRDHWVLRYWQDQFGNERYDWDALEAISPAHHAEKFSAPVLLMHGRQDTVVPFEQSKIMAKALEKAGKQVEFVELDGGDHWLSGSETRVESLQLAADFVDRHLRSD